MTMCYYWLYFISTILARDKFSNYFLRFGISCLDQNMNEFAQGLQVGQVDCLVWILSYVVCIPGFPWLENLVCLPPLPLCMSTLKRCSPLWSGTRQLGPAGGQDRGHHLPPPGPAEGVLAPCPFLHHGGGGHNCWGPGCLLPRDSGGETTRNNG